MNRRDFIRIGMTGSGAMLGGTAMAAPGKAGFAIVEASVADLQAAMQAGKLTARALVKIYLARIRAIDRAGLRIMREVATPLLIKRAQLQNHPPEKFSAQNATPS